MNIVTPPAKELRTQLRTIKDLQLTQFIKKKESRESASKLL